MAIKNPDSIPYDQFKVDALEAQLDALLVVALKGQSARYDKVGVVIFGEAGKALYLEQEDKIELRKRYAIAGWSQVLFEEFSGESGYDLTVSFYTYQ